MEANFKARIIGAIATVLALALILPNILQGEKKAEYSTEIPAKPSTPNWVDESQSPLKQANYILNNSLALFAVVGDSFEAKPPLNHLPGFL